MDEKVLVIKKELVDAFGEGHKLIKVNYSDLMSVVNKSAEFMPRSSAETNFNYKQIIPYVIFRYNNEIFCTSRKQKQTEQRLHNKLSIGIGGHINDTDLNTEMDECFNHGMTREIHEEILVNDNINPVFIGVINNNEIEVDSVHVGVCFIVDLQSANVAVKETNKMTGKFENFNDLISNYSYLEEWSKIVVDSMVGEKSEV